MPASPLPWRPSAHRPHLERWAPLFATCAALQRANCASGLLLTPIDVSGDRMRMVVHPPEGGEGALEPPPDLSPEDLRLLLGDLFSDIDVVPPLPGHDHQFWAPEQHDPEPLRYAWLLDQLSIDSTHWRMRGLELTRIELLVGSATADVTLRKATGGTVVARVPLLSGQELVGAQDWIASRVVTTLDQAESFGGSPPLVELPS